MNLHRTTLLAAIATTLTTSIAAADPARDRADRVTVTSTTAFMDGACCSTPAVLLGVDVGYDHAMGPALGLRARAGAILIGLDEIEGTAPHLEVGGFVQHRLGARVTLDASALAGLEYGALDHKDSVEPDLGPTVATEAALRTEFDSGLTLVAGAGYRLSWAQNDPGEVAHGALVRLGVGWAF